MATVYVNPTGALSANDERKLVLAACELLMLVCASEGSVSRNRPALSALSKAVEHALGPQVELVAPDELPFQVSL